MNKCCPRCKSTHDKSGIFCSRACANSRIQTPEMREKKRIKLRKYDYKICPICNNSFMRKQRKNFTKTCSKECGRKMGTTLMRDRGDYLNRGGLRNGSGRGKCGWYKGYYLYSTYEMAYLVYCLDHNIKIKRCDFSYEYEWNGKKLKYYPDFLVDDTIIEIKGYWTAQVDAKKESVTDMPISVLYKKDLVYVFNYIQERYGINYTKLHKWYEK